MFFSGSNFGLDISDFSIEALELKKSFNQYKIQAYSRIKLPSGIVENGAILKMPELVSHIQEMLASAKPKPIKPKGICLSLPESRVFTNIINLPANLKSQEIDEAIQNQIPEIFPYNAEDIVSAWKVLKKDEKEQDLLVAAIDKELFKQYIELTETLNFKVITLENESISTARAIMPTAKDNEGLLLLDIGARTTNISIFDNKGLYTTYNTDIAGQKITDIISKKLKISQTEAEKKKISFGLNYKKNDGELLLIIQSLFQELLPEIKKSIDHFEETTRKNIKSGYLCGGSALLPGIDEYLSSNLKIPINMGKPFTNIDDSDNIIPKRSSILFSNVSGLAMQAADKKTDANSINFI